MNAVKQTNRRPIKLGTWNVRGLLKTGKLHIVENEMRNYNLALLGLSETHWKGSGHFSTGSGNTVYFSSKNESKNGVAFLVPRTINDRVAGYNPISDRIIGIKIRASPCNINVLQVYAPTADSSEQEIEEFYGELELAIVQIPRREILMVSGDMNAKVGSTRDEEHLRNTVGRFGMGTRNERGERLIQFCQEKSLTIASTCFQHHIRRLYTWRSPGDRVRNQIDYIMISSRWRSSIFNTRTYPGAECGSDHQLLVANLKIKFKAAREIQKNSKPTKRTVEEFKVEIRSKIAELKRKLKEDDTSDIKWGNIKQCIDVTKTEIERRNVGSRSKNNKHWITAETLDKIEKRKNIKNKGLHTEESRQQYTALNKDIQRRCRQDKNDHIKKVCEDIERHQNTNQTRDLHEKVKLLSRKFKPKTFTIQDRAGNILWQKEQVLERWRTYCEDLYHDSQGKDCVLWGNDQELLIEPDILRSEIEEAIFKLKQNKSPGSDGISSEIVKALGEDGVAVLHDLCNAVWKTGEWPIEWTKSIFIPLHKKGSPLQCQNYRTISLIPHASKVLLRIIDRRLQKYLDRQIPAEQAGFVQGKGTREQIFNIRQIIEKAREFNITAFLCFIDYSKAFDSVVWSHLWVILKEMGVPEHLVLLIRNLYKQSEAVVRVENNSSEPFRIRKGVRQGCVLSPRLFNVYGEHIMRRSLDNFEGGVSIGGKKISNLRYADDTTLITATEEELERVMEKVINESRALGLEINLSKTKLMVIDRGSSAQLENRLPNIQRVEEFVYLGSLITASGGSTNEIKRRIAIARNAMSNLEKIWKDRQITTNTKKRLVRSLIHPIFLYGAESWTLCTADRNRADAFEMWCWRRMLRIPWTARRTNVSILKELQITERLSKECRRRILAFFGHISRKGEDCLEKLIVQGKVEGRRPRGRSPTRWLDQVKLMTQAPLQETLLNTQDRGKWRAITKTCS